MAWQNHKEDAGVGWGRRPREVVTIDSFCDGRQTFGAPRKLHTDFAGAIDILVKSQEPRRLTPAGAKKLGCEHELFRYAC